MALLLDETTWDLALPVRKATASEQIRQSVKIRLMTRRGEWQFDLDQGLPYVEAMLVKNPDLALLESIVRAEVLLVPGVISVARASVELDATTRALSIACDLVTDEGLLSVTV